MEQAMTQARSSPARENESSSAVRANGASTCTATSRSPNVHTNEARPSRLGRVSATKRRSAEAAEGLASFVEKRAARWFSGSGE